MARYGVTMMIEFTGELEAGSEKEAEAMAWESWSDDGSRPIVFDSVYSIDMQELDEDEVW
jgi:hypothetical protein